MTIATKENTEGESAPPCLRALAPSRANAPSGSPKTPLPRRGGVGELAPPRAGMRR
jgi:hypothetical protein